MGWVGFGGGGDGEREGSSKEIDSNSRLQRWVCLETQMHLVEALRVPVPGSKLETTPPPHQSPALTWDIELGGPLGQFVWGPWTLLPLPHSALGGGAFNWGIFPNWKAASPSPPGRLGWGRRGRVPIRFGGLGDLGSDSPEGTWSLLSRLDSLDFPEGSPELGRLQVRKDVGLGSRSWPGLLVHHWGVGEGLVPTLNSECW